MTDPLERLERSLREGPRDERGYQFRPLEIDAKPGKPSPVRIGALPPIVREHQGSRPRLRWSGPSLAMLLIVAVGLAGFAILVRQNPSAVNGPAVSASPSPTPTPTSRASPSPQASSFPSILPAASPVAIPSLSQTFVSSRNGFSVRYPAGWTVKPATESWLPDTYLPQGNPALDDLELAGAVRLVVASQRIAAGQTEDQWLAAYAPTYQGSSLCATNPATSPRLSIDGQSGYLDMSACATALDASIAAGGVTFDAIVFSGGRAYQITLDGLVDRAFFDAVLATIKLDPLTAVDPPGLP